MPGRPSGVRLAAALRTHAEPDVWPADAAGRQGVLLVHGYLCNRAIWNPWLRCLRARGIPAVAVTLEPPGAALDTHVPTLAAAAQQLWLRTGRAPLLVGHSMGGLALRAWWRADGGRTPVAGLVTVGTPHQGTWMALWGHSDSARQMQPGSAWLRQLAADEARLRAEGSEAPAVLSVFSPCDSIVFPTQGAVWPGGEALAVAGAGHVDLLQHAAVFEAVCQRLEGARAEAGAAGTERRRPDSRTGPGLSSPAGHSHSGSISSQSRARPSATSVNCQLPNHHSQAPSTAAAHSQRMRRPCNCAKPCRTKARRQARVHSPATHRCSSAVSSPQGPACSLSTSSGSSGGRALKPAATARAMAP